MQLANITVYYIMQKAVYSKPNLMKNIASIKRYIDDEPGIFTGVKSEFISWIRDANAELAK